MMDEVIKGSINPDAFQRFLYDEAKAGRLSKDDFTKLTGVSSKSSAQNQVQLQEPLMMPKETWQKISHHGQDWMIFQEGLILLSSR